MKPWGKLLPALISFVTVACGPTTSELYKQDVALAREQCSSYGRSLNSRGQFSWAQFERECQQTYRAVWNKYGIRPDVFEEASLAYRLAVYERVDRKEITSNQAEFLTAEFKRRLEVERAQLESAQRQAAAADAAASWGTFWQNWLLYQQQQYRFHTPIKCTTSYIGTTAYTNCY